MSNNIQPLVYFKDDQASSFTVDVTPLLLTGETVTSVTIVQTIPATTPMLTYGTPVVPTSSTTFTLPANSGVLGTTYGTQLQVTTSGARTLTVTIAVLVDIDLSVPYSTKSPNAFQALVDSIQAGDASVGTAFFMLPAGTDVSQGFVKWSLIDSLGTLYSTGNAYSYTINNGSMSTDVTALAVVNVPSETPPTLEAQRYQIRWELHLDPTNPTNVQVMSEGVTVLGQSSVPLGPDSPVEMYGDLAQPGLVLDRLYASVGIEVYQGNNLVVHYSVVNTKSRVSGGWYYSTQIDTSVLKASLEPFNLSWKYNDGSGPNNRETGRLYVVNSSMLNAIEDVRQLVMKARTTMLGFPDTLFDTTTIIAWLRRAKDMFNAASGMITSFDMTNASGGIREYWLSYAEVAMLRAQYLAEGEKAFEFQGQAISLNTDKTQYYQGLADTLQQRLDAEMKPFKQNLKIMAVTSGDGDLDNASGQIGAMGAIGIGLNAVSPGYGYRRYW